MKSVTDWLVSPIFEIQVRETPHSLTKFSSLEYYVMTPKNGLQPGEPIFLPLQCRLNPRQSILVVDDDANIRRLDTEVLTGHGYKVDAAADGADAWDILQFNHYDLLVTDYNMPKMSGVELLLKLHAACTALPVIMASGTIPTEQLKRHPWLQIDATLLKPYTPEELLATVRNVLHVTNNIIGQVAPLSGWQDQQAS